MDFLTEFKSRGFFHQATDEATLTKQFNDKKLTVYIGFDCTADSLHVGSLMQIMVIRLLQKHGHQPIILLGGGTTKIGDPSGRDETRRLLDDNGINNNLKGIEAVFKQFIDFDCPNTGAKIVNNNDWLSGLNYIDFLRQVGPHFSINRMLTFDSVKLRLEREQTLSFLEFNYMILQAYDFVKLAEQHNCTLQIGGSDQWGNIVNGIELARRLGKNKELYGLTTPLITTSSGAKMGKTASGAIWLTADKLSPYDYYQFWRNTEDADVIRFIKYFTELDNDKIDELSKLQGQQINETKKILAYEATKLCHGADEAKRSAEAATKMFEQGSISANLPTYEVNKDILQQGIPAYKLFADSGLCTTGGEAKRIIKGGGGKINDNKIADAFDNIDTSHLVDDIIKLSAGKKKHILVKAI